VVVFDAKEGVEAQSETVWRQADKYLVPRICFMNKMDKTGADFEHGIATIRTRLGGHPIPVHLPIGQENSFVGFIDLIEMHAIVYDPSTDGKKFQVQEIPDDLAETAQQQRGALEEQVAELDEELMNQYLETGTLTNEELKRGLRKGTIERACQPTLCGSSLRYMGVQALLDAVVDYLPAPTEVPPVTGHDPKKPDKIIPRKCDPKEPLAVLVFKIVADAHGDLFFLRVYSGTLKASSRLTNVRNGTKENVAKLYRIFAKRREQVDSVSAGDIIATTGLKDTLTGDTLCEAQGQVLLERIEFPETVISMAIEPKSSADRDKLEDSLSMLSRGDPTFEFRSDPETGQTLISGMGELHLEVMCHRLERDFNVAVRVGKPRVAYRETITTAADHEMKFERQLGTKNQFAQVKVRVEPFTPEPGQEHFAFENQLPENRIRDHFQTAIESAARDAVRSGPLGSYPLINVKVTILDAAEHPEDSSEVAFESATTIAIMKALEAANPVLLEPVMKVEVVTPEDYFGPINGDLMTRRAIIAGTHIRGHNHVIDAEVPLSAMFGYATQVRSLSQGRASYSMEPLRYEPMPPNLAKEVLGVL
jgi:elongation factor G